MTMTMTAQALPLELQFASAGAVVRRLGAERDKCRARKASISTQASDSTFDSFDSGSLSDGSGDRDDWSTLLDQDTFKSYSKQPVGLLPQSTQKRTFQEETSKQVKGRQVTQVVGPATTVSLANSPTDFATAWKNAAGVEGWKRTEPQGRGAWPKQQKESKQGNKGKKSPPVVVHKEEPRPVGRVAEPAAPVAKFMDCTKEADFFKWFAQQETKTAIAAPVATPAPTPVPRPLKLAPPPGLPPPGVFAVLEQSQFVLAGGHGKPDLDCPMKVSMPNEEDLAEFAGPFKIEMPEYECPQPYFDPTKPCKKRLPEWVFESF